MSDKHQARRTTIEVAFDGVDMTNSIGPYLLSFDYTDNEADEADDLQIRLQDRDGVWLNQWLPAAIDASGGRTLQIGAVLVRENWHSDGVDEVLDCGQFELDSLNYGGPPSELTIKATALPYSSQIRQTKRSKAWESYKLSGIAKEMATDNGMQCMVESAKDPSYERVEQYMTSDIVFLSQLCHDAGISLKVTNNILVLFDQVAYETKPTILTIRRGGGGYTRFKLGIGTAQTQYASCRVSYVVPPGGKLIEGIAFVEDYKAESKNNQQLEISARISSIAEAKALAEKRLRLHNKHEKNASFTIPGNPAIVAGVTVLLEAFGAWDGNYMVSQAKHSVGNGGYTVQLKLRKVLEGY